MFDLQLYTLPTGQLSSQKRKRKKMEVLEHRERERVSESERKIAIDRI